MHWKHNWWLHWNHSWSYHHDGLSSSARLWIGRGREVRLRQQVLDYNQATGIPLIVYHLYVKNQPFWELQNGA